MLSESIQTLAESEVCCLLIIPVQRILYLMFTKHIDTTPKTAAVWSPSARRRRRPAAQHPPVGGHGPPRWCPRRPTVNRPLCTVAPPPAGCRTADC